MPKDVHFSPALRWAVAGFAGWVLANILGFGIVISDLSDMEAYPGPLGDVIPTDLEFPILGICFAVAVASMIFSTGAIIRTANQQTEDD